MTTLFPITVACAVCGRPNSILSVGSTNAFGSMDLDMRPPPMARDLVRQMICECKQCGFCAPDLSSTDEIGIPDVTSSGYLAARSDPRFPVSAARYRAHAFLAESAGFPKRAAWAYLQAAWVCDDDLTHDASAADVCRRDVLGQLQVLHGLGQSLEGDGDTDFVLSLDLLRRTGQFDAVSDAIRNLETGRLGSPLVEIVALQQRLALSRDTGCYRVEHAG